MTASSDLKPRDEIADKTRENAVIGRFFGIGLQNIEENSDTEILIEKTLN